MSSKNLLITMVLISLLFSSPVFAESAVAEMGRLNLVGQDFTSKNMVSLEGEWLVSFNKLLDVPGFYARTKDNFPVILSGSGTEMETSYVPSSWNDIYQYDHMHPGWGVASYVLYIKLHRDSKDLGLYLPAQSTSFDLWINGTRIHSLGTVSDDPQIASPQYRFLHQEIPNDLLDDFFSDEEGYILQLVLRVSNFSHRRGGPWRPILLANRDQVETYNRFQHTFDGSLALIFLFLSIYNLARYFLSNRKLKSALVLSGLFLSLMLRAMVVGNILLTLLFPNFSWDLLLRLEYLSAHLIGIHFSIIMYIIFKRFFSLSMLYLFLTLTFVSAFVLLTHSVYDYSFLIYKYVFLLMIFLGFLTVMLARAWMYRSSGVAVGLASIVICFLMIFSETLLFREAAVSRELIPLGFLISVVELGSVEELTVQIVGGMLGIILIVSMAVGLITRFSHGIYREDYLGLEEIERDVLFRIFPNANKLSSGDIDIILAFYHGFSIKELQKSLFISKHRLRRRIKSILKNLGANSMEELIFNFRVKMKPLPR